MFTWELGELVSAGVGIRTEFSSDDKVTINGLRKARL